MDREVLGKVMIAYGAVTLVILLMVYYMFSLFVSMNVPFMGSMMGYFTIMLYLSLVVSLVLIFYGIFLVKKKFK